MNVSKAALFASGLFFGGALDHAILASMRRDLTPYGVKGGVSGNCLLAVADLAVAGVLYGVHSSSAFSRTVDDATENVDLRVER
jgi:hypothetical protein